MLPPQWTVLRPGVREPSPRCTTVALHLHTKHPAAEAVVLAPPYLLAHSPWLEQLLVADMQAVYEVKHCGSGLVDGRRLGAPGAVAGGFGGCVFVAVAVGHDGFGVATAAEVGSCGRGAPVVELGGAAGFGQEDEKDFEVAGGNELAESGKILEEGVNRLGGLFRMSALRPSREGS